MTSAMKNVEAAFRKASSAGTQDQGSDKTSKTGGEIDKGRADSDTRGRFERYGDQLPKVGFRRLLG